MNLPPPFGFGEEDPTAYIISMLGLAIFAVFLFYGMRLQLASLLWQLGKHVRRVEKLSKNAKRRLLDSIKEHYTGDEAELLSEIDEAINVFAIRPISLDPHKVVPKLDHVLRLRDKEIEGTIEMLVPDARRATKKNLSNLLELTIELENIKKTLQHYYIAAKKNKDLIALSYMQIYLPFLMEAAEAYGSGINAFAEGEPVGDSVGPLVVRNIIGSSKPRRIAEDTVFYEKAIDGRRVIAVKAEGPGGTVGRLGDALEKVLDIYRGTRIIVTIDAALKLEGEETGSIAEGVGVAMGGPGTDRFVIETIATRRNIPLYAIVVKMSEKEAVSEMNEKVRAAVPLAVERFRRLLEEKSEPGDTVLLVGVGNTIGVP